MVIGTFRVKQYPEAVPHTQEIPTGVYISEINFLWLVRILIFFMFPQLVFKSFLI